MTTKERFQSRARRGLLKADNLTPSTGIGKFDVRYDATAGQLNVTLKVWYKFQKYDDTDKLCAAWTPAEQVAFRADFKSLVERTWSDCYTIASDKPAWREYYARVAVHVVEVTSAAAAHYTIQANKVPKGNTFRSGIDRPNWTGCFSEWDVFPEEKLKRDQGAMEFKLRQVAEQVTAGKVDYLAFPAGSAALPTAAAVALNGFASQMNRVLSKELVDAGFRLYVYGKLGSAEGRMSNLLTAKKRAGAVADFLKQKLSVKGAVAVVDGATKEPWIVPDVTATLTRHGFAAADVQARAFPGAMVLVKDPGQGGLNTAGMKRNYAVAAHECGHMFGLPDEYFGVNCLQLEQQVNLLSIVPAAVANLTRIPAAPDPDLATQAQAFAILLQQSGAPSPVFMSSTSTVTTSIMYAGSDVLPAHYLTFWEALLQVCYPFFNPADWKIVPNKAGEGKKSNLAFFAK